MYFKRLKSICESKVKDLGDKYKERLDDELLRVLDWDKHGLKKSEELMKKRLFVKGAETNKSGSLILFLLGISKIDPIKDDLKLTEVVMVQGDMPDIDTDFLPEIRQGVKRKIVEKYGKQFTCSIGAYGNFKTKKSILEAAGVLSYDIQEAMRATKQMDSLADHEMEDDDEDDKKLDSMTFDEISHSYPDFGSYLAKYPDVRQHAEAIRGQISNMSKHAGGVIISSADVTKIVPLILDKDGDMVSCWTEGAASQELSIKGLIKYDILGLCLEENTLVDTDLGPIEIKKCGGRMIRVIGKNGDYFTGEFVLIESGERPIFKIEFEDGSNVLTTMDHKFFRIN